LQGANPQLMSRILDEIVNEYIRQRGAEQRDEASALEASYARQLDESKAALRDADDRYARLLERTGVSDPEAESQSLLQQSNALELQLAEAEQRRAELSSRLGDGHPAIKAINLQVADAGLTLRRLAARREALARAERELAKIRRDRQALNEGVLTLFSQRSKVDAMLSAEGDSVRLLDRPETPLQAVTPGVSTMIILSCFGGLAAGLFASFLKNAILRRQRPRVLPQREMRFRLISLARTESTEASQ
jgi:tyrosine-protein kinase Etk/Wzc